MFSDGMLKIYSVQVFYPRRMESGQIDFILMESHAQADFVKTTTFIVLLLSWLLSYYYNSAHQFS